ncbi:MAG: hypothetical protein ABIJ95_03305 [Pseudomonadota bacterium]
MAEIALLSIEGKDLADGVETLETGIADRLCGHRVVVELSAAPSAGTLAVAFRSPGASKFVLLATLDLTAPADPAEPTVFAKDHAGPVAEWKFTPAGIVPAPTTWSAYIAAWEV